MKKKLLKKFHLSLILTFSVMLGYSQATLPAYEGFDYTIGDQLIDDGLTTGLGDWAVISTGTGDVLVEAQPSWAIPGIDTTSGAAIGIDASGIDPHFVFTDQTGSFGTVYASVLIQVTNMDDINTTEYRFFGIGTLNSGGSYSGGSTVFIREDSTDGTKFNLGFNSSNSTTGVVWYSTAFSVSDQIMIVISHNDANTGVTGQMWVNPSLGGAEPTPDLTGNDRNLDADRIEINQHSSSNTPTMIFDELRVAKSWAGATKPSTLSVASSELSNLKMYPNPVTSDRKLFIDSQSLSEKEITIYSLLGKVVHSETTSSKLINLKDLASGAYILKVTEDGNVGTKKLIVQ